MKTVEGVAVSFTRCILTDQRKYTLPLCRCLSSLRLSWLLSDSNLENIHFSFLSFCFLFLETNQKLKPAFPNSLNILSLQSSPSAELLTDLIAKPACFPDIKLKKHVFLLFISLFPADSKSSCLPELLFFSQTLVNIFSCFLPSSF